jgi:AcrR family transcriptional regulator
MQREQHSSKSRLLAAAKALFAEKGYEATAIAQITREAGTSHSQFLKYYSGKEDLRTEIIEQQWSELTNALVLATAGMQSAGERLKLALNMFVSLLENDSEFRAILLLEQTVRRDREGIVISPEFRRFVNVIGEIVNAMKAQGELSPDVNAEALRAALIGAVEGMMRDQSLASGDFPARYSVIDIRKLLSIFADAPRRVRRLAPEPEVVISEGTLYPRSTEDEWIRYYLKLGDTALNPAELS